MLSPFLKMALILGLLSTAGPLTIDMYLPALPTMADELSISEGAAQLTLTVYFFAVGLSQLAYGPLTDRFGRRAPMLGGLSLYIVASILCVLAPSLGWLLVGRVLQGLGAAATMVISRAVIRDLHTGVEATRLMAVVMLVIAISPMVAPMLGSFILDPLGWRAIFIALAILGAAGVTLILCFLPETLPAARRRPLSFSALKQASSTLVRDPFFMGLTAINSLAISSFFAFLSTAAFLYIDRYGLTEKEFSLAFAVNAIGFFVCTQAAAPLAKRFGANAVLRAASAASAVFGTALLLLTLAGMDNFWGLSAMLFFTYAFMGLIIPSTMTMALDAHGPIAGMASALAGTIQTVSGAFVTALMGVAHNGTPVPVVLLIGACTIGAFIITRLTVPRAAVPAAASTTGAPS